MKYYHKIETVFNRDVDGTKNLVVGDWRDETVKFLSDCEWIFTEKVDGTNTVVYWDGHTVSFGGRTEKTQIPNELLEVLKATFGTNEAEELFEQTFGEKEVYLYGEGYGGKIQGGAGYGRETSFILFDVMIGGNYQEREWVEKTAKMFGVDAVPVVLVGTIQDGIDFVKMHHKSTLGNTDMEGVVGRPRVELLDRRGRRIIAKIKWKDFRCFA